MRKAFVTITIIALILSVVGTGVIVFVESNNTVTDVVAP